MNMWLKNSRFLKKTSLSFYEKATSNEYSNPDLKIADISEDGNFIMQNSNCRCNLHSKYNPSREMEELFRDTGDPEQILIIFGLGMGNCIDYIREKRLKYKQILIIEPCNNIFRELLKKRDIASLLNVKNLSITLFKDAREIIGQIFGMTISSRKVKVLYHLSYRSIYKDLFQEITRVFSNEKLALQSSARTMDILLYEWSQNQLKSIQQQYASAAVFYKQFQDIPAVIVSAGPSLEKRIEEIKEIQDRALIIAPGTGAKICSKRGINAHLAMAIDSSVLVADIVKDSNLDILIGAYRLNPQVDLAFPNRVLKIALSTELIAKYYHNYMSGSVDFISDYSSVSCAAVEYAIKLGCNPIILVGQDLCYYDNKDHADEEANSLEQNRIMNWQEAKDINGELVYTDELFLAMRRDMELLNLNNSAIMINASEAGLGIPGIENFTFSDVIDQYINRKEVNITEKINDILNKIDKTNNENYGVDAFFQHILNEIEINEKINGEKQDELTKINLLLEKGFSDNRLNSSLYFIEEKNQELMSNNFYTNIIMASVDRFLLFYFAGSLYNAKNEQDARAKIIYESKVYELTNRYMQMLKQLVQTELKEIEPESASDSLKIHF